MNRPFLTGLMAVLSLMAALTAHAAPAKPNVLIIYVDDMGWAQPSCYGGKLVPTPNMDAIAASGVRFTDGYVSACICSPSRVGIMTGRYQARSGHDANPTRPGTELVLTETTLGQRMKTAGYYTGIIGKWHLGATNPEFLPVSRGFDYSMGTVGNLGEGKGPAYYRGSVMMDEMPGAPVTSPIYAKEACNFFEEHKAEPWFLYLPFNAVHAPHVASDPYLKKYSSLPQRDRQYAALAAEMDDAIGQVMGKLRDLKLEENTLVFLISDNGGAAPQAEMGGLRGRKWYVWEGGIRVSWMVQWKGHIKPGQVSHVPVLQLDVMPTVLAAAGVEVQPAWQLDGMNLLPLLEGKTQTLDRKAMYWRFGVQYAIREGDWKLVKAGKDLTPMLVNLAQDMGETTDLTEKEPAKAKQLQADFDKWNAEMKPPRWEDQRWDGDPDRKASKKEKKAGKG